MSDFLTVWLLAITLALDAMAVSVANGLSVRGWTKKHSLIAAAYFGAFQVIMPLLGWLLGSSVLEYVGGFDHWIAFGLLALIGGRMIREALRKKDDKAQESPREGLTQGRLLLQAVATSIDALAAGLTLAFLPVNIWVSVGIIGAVAFGLSLLGGFLGRRLGSVFQKRAEFAAGIVLVLLGVKILMEHLTA